MPMYVLAVLPEEEDYYDEEGGRVHYYSSVVKLHASVLKHLPTTLQDGKLDK